MKTSGLGGCASFGLQPESVVPVVLDRPVVTARPVALDGECRHRSGIQFALNRPTFIVILMVELVDLGVQPMELFGDPRVLIQPLLPFADLVVDVADLLLGLLQSSRELALLGFQELVQLLLGRCHSFGV